MAPRVLVPASLSHTALSTLTLGVCTLLPLGPPSEVDGDDDIEMSEVAGDKTVVVLSAVWEYEPDYFVVCEKHVGERWI